MKRRGSVLIIVLWSLFIMGALAVAISGYVSAQISIAKKLSDRARGYYLARAAVERAVLEVKVEAADKKDATNNYDALSEPWSDNTAEFKDHQMGDGTYSVLPLSAAPPSGAAVRYGMSDEESKVNVNKASLEVLKNFFKIACELDDENSLAIAASILNWRNPAGQTEKGGADSFHYQTLDHPYDCKNAPLESLDELLLIDGITKDIFDKVKSRLTVYGGGAININTADKMVLQAIGMEEGLADKIVHFRSSEDDSGKVLKNVFTDTATIADVLSKKESLSGGENGKISSLIAQGLLTVTSDNFSGTAVGRTGNAPGAGGSGIVFVFDRKNNVMRYWRE